LLDKLKNFLIEVGRDFFFVGSEYLLQVGDRDFALDLLSSIEASTPSLLSN
jgi:predicted nuclease of restriction endonuclease-like (RecB) superfamily